MTTHEKWAWGCTHLFHDNTWAKFVNDQGHKLRPFSSNKEMHETMLFNHNKIVGVNDYVYWLGDVTFYYGKSFVEIMHAFNGKKRLIVGNHDGLYGQKYEALAKCFEKIELWKGFSDKDNNSCGFTMTHIPLPLPQLRDGAFNVHAHMHDREMVDKHYISTCVEKINYTPRHFDQLFETIRERQKDFDNQAKIDKIVNS